MTIEARIAEIISEYEVAFTVGSEAGVQDEDIATVFRRIDVVDPETDKSLGVVTRPAIRFQIVEVQPSLSVGETYETVSPDEAFNFQVAIFGGNKRRKRVVRTQSEQDRRSVFLKVGDEVVIESSDQDDAVEQAQLPE